MTRQDIQRLSVDIATLAYHKGYTLDEAAAKVEAEMDGSQPKDLVANARDRAAYLISVWPTKS